MTRVRVVSFPQANVRFLLPCLLHPDGNAPFITANGHVLTSHSPDAALSGRPVGLFSAKPPRFHSCSFNTHTHNENDKMRCHSIFFLKTVMAVLAHVLVLVTLDCKTSCRVPSWNAGWNSVYEPGRVLGPQGMGVLLEVRPARGELTQDKHRTLGKVRAEGRAWG